jgi:hypothetical protein
MITPAIVSEKKNHVTAVFAETYYQIMRTLRYGFRSCKNCGDAEQLSLEWEILCWLDQSQQEVIMRLNHETESFRNSHDN